MMTDGLNIRSLPGDDICYPVRYLTIGFGFNLIISRNYAYFHHSLLLKEETYYIYPVYLYVKSDGASQFSKILN